MKIALIDYGAGNLQSVENALTKLGQKSGIVSRPEELARFQKVIIPGQGAAGSAIQRLLETGFLETLADLSIPFLGICLGMQLLAEFSEEDNVQCLFVIPGRVKKLPTMKIANKSTSSVSINNPSRGTTVKIPHMGWNKVHIKKSSVLLEGIPDQSYFYFAHSYYFDAAERFVAASTTNGIAFPAIVERKNFYGTQFHPEKSGEVGLQLLRNFCEKC